MATFQKQEPWNDQETLFVGWRNRHWRRCPFTYLSLRMRLANNYVLRGVVLRPVRAERETPFRLHFTCWSRVEILFVCQESALQCNSSGMRWRLVIRGELSEKPNLWDVMSEKGELWHDDKIAQGTVTVSQLLRNFEMRWEVDTNLKPCQRRHNHRYRGFRFQDGHYCYHTQPINPCCRCRHHYQ